MATIQSGARGTVGLLSDLIAQNMVKKVVQLNPSAGPLTSVINILDKYLETETAEPQHAEDELLPNRDLVNGAHTPADTTIEVDNPGFYLVGDILHIPRTGENMRVTTAAGTSPITVVRGASVGSAPAALVDDEPIWILGGAQREGDTSRTALNTLEIPKTEFCQIIRNSVHGTEVQLATRQLGGDFQSQFDKKLIEHKRQCDSFFKWGTKSSATVSGQTLRTMEGLNPWIQTNRMAVDGTLGEGEWDAFLEMNGAYGGSRKLFVCSARVARAINNFAKNRLVTVPQDETYGLSIQSYISNGLDVWIVVDQEMKGAQYGGFGFLVDPDYLVVRPLLAAGMGEKYDGTQYCKRVENIQANDEAARKDEIYSCLTLHKFHERTAGVLEGVEG